jgi:hypothetical protein
VEVVVAFGEGVVGGCYYGFEEVGGFERQRLEVEVPDEVFEDAELWLVIGLVYEASFARQSKGSYLHARQKVSS